MHDAGVTVKTITQDHKNDYEGKDEEEDDDSSEMDADGTQCRRGRGNIQVRLQGIDGHQMHSLCVR